MADESGFFRGAGGAIWEMRLPLSGDMAEQLVKGYLIRVNEDGSSHAPPADPASEGAAVGDVEKPPASNASKAMWVGYVHRAHDVSIDDAEAMTKNDLVELYGSKG